jgi:hypothetical protein
MELNHDRGLSEFKCKLLHRSDPNESHLTFGYGLLKRTRVAGSFRLFWDGVPVCVEEELHPEPKCLEGGIFRINVGFFIS